MTEVDTAISTKTGVPRRLRSLGAFLLIMQIPAVFYLFVVPAMAVSKTWSVTGWNWLFILFLYLQAWFLAFNWFYEALASLYAWNRRELLSSKFFLIAREDLEEPQRRVGAFGTVVKVMLSYLLTIYGFALGFVYISNFTVSAFNVGRLSILDGLYFSLITTATVGYGDIYPTSSLARLLVCFEVLISFVYAVFLFSVVATVARERLPSGDVR